MVLQLDGLPRSVTVGATATPVWADGSIARAPAWSGLTTAVLVVVGDTLADGDPVARVDGVEVRYYELETPLFQPVCTHDTVLVSEVRGILQSVGLDVGTTESLRWTDILAIRAYAESIGVPNAKQVSCFQPGWVVSTTDPIGKLGEVDLLVGALAPALGATVLVGTPVLESVELTGNTGSSSIDDHLTVEGAQTFDSTELLVVGASTGVGLGDLNDPVALETLAGLIDPTLESFGMAVRLSLRDSQLVVPATSVVDLASDHPCVEAGADGLPVAVSIVASSISGLIIDFGDQSLPSQIRVEPGSASCA